MNPRTSLLAITLLVACADSPTDPVRDVAAPGAAFGKTPSNPGVAETYDHTAGLKIMSDGRPSTIFNVVTPNTFVNGQCGVIVVFSLTDVVVDLPGSLSRTAICTDGIKGIRKLSFTLDTPVNAGDPSFGTVATNYHHKLNSVQNVADSAYVNIGFGFISGTLVMAGDCHGIRFNPAYGGDLVRVRRTLIKGMNGADRNEWVVETVGDNDRAACTDSSNSPRRLYHMPFRITVTQL
jgi:hypothetical protein